MTGPVPPVRAVYNSSEQLPTCTKQCAYPFGCRRLLSTQGKEHPGGEKPLVLFFSLPSLIHAPVALVLWWK